LSGWAGLGGGITDLAAAVNQDGRLEVFAIGTDGALNHIWQTSAGANSWSGWTGLGGSLIRLAAAKNSDGSLEVLAIGSDTTLNHIWQTSPGAGWSSWSGLGGSIRRLAAAANSDGRLEVFSIGTDGALYHVWQTSPGESGGEHPVFPISASQDDSFPDSGGVMHTDVTVYASGLLNAVTHTHEMTALRGFKGAVAVTLLDQNQKNPWTTTTQHFGVDGYLIGTSDRTDNWTTGVPPDVLANARYIAVNQQWDPNLVADIGNWIAGLSNIAQQLGPIIQVIKTIAG
jgi:hypothetical protein